MYIYVYIYIHIHIHIRACGHRVSRAWCRRGTRAHSLATFESSRQEDKADATGHQTRGIKRAA